VDVEADSPLAAYKAVPFRALADQPMVVFPHVGRPNFVDRVVELCKQHGFEPHIAQEVGDAVTGGTLNQRGTLTVEIRAVGEATRLAQIIRLVEQAQGSKAPIQKLADQVSAWFVPSVIVCAVLSFAVWSIYGPEARITYVAIDADGKPRLVPPLEG